MNINVEDINLNLFKSTRKNGAGYGTRTRDIKLEKSGLNQLSHTRKYPQIYIFSTAKSQF